jgi:hypothetical protein
MMGSRWVGGSVTALTPWHIASGLGVGRIRVVEFVPAEQVIELEVRWSNMMSMIDPQAVVRWPQPLLKARE